MLPNPIVVWRVTDGKKGHEKQTEGLIQGLNSLESVSLQIHTLSSKNSFRATYKLPRPHLFIGAGHATHLPMIRARLVFGGRSVLLMKPSVPAILFDLVFIPQHDTGVSFGNVFYTEGVLGPSLSLEPYSSTGVILLGGESRHFEFNPTQIEHQVNEIALKSPMKQWYVCDSPRTPIQLLQESEFGDNVRINPWKETSPTFLTELLATSSETWVTSDSVTMLYEALSTNAKVGVMVLPRKRKIRGSLKLIQGLESLVSNGRVHLSTQGLCLSDVSTNPIGTSEIERCAQIVVSRLLLN